MVGRQIFSAYIVKTGNFDTDRDSATGGEVIEQILSDYQADIIKLSNFSHQMTSILLSTQTIR